MGHRTLLQQDFQPRAHRLRNAIHTQIARVDTPTELLLAACRIMDKSAQNPPARSIFHPFLSQYARY